MEPNLDELVKERLDFFIEEDHAIVEISRTFPTNCPLYRVNAAQQEEIMNQVNELLKKGLIQPSLSP